MFRASERCHQEKRKTINGEDILFAMSTLGFDSYVEPLKQYLQKYREVRVAPNEIYSQQKKFIDLDDNLFFWFEVHIHPKWLEIIVQRITLSGISDFLVDTWINQKIIRFISNHLIFIPFSTKKSIILTLINARLSPTFDAVEIHMMSQYTEFRLMQKSPQFFN